MIRATISCSSIFVGQPSDYESFARDYYEAEIPEAVVADVFAVRPITDFMVNELNPATTLQQISAELYEEIRYPRSS